MFTPIRELFAQVKTSRERGYGPGRFSFNVKGGRCEACQGDGLIKVEMHFLPDLYVSCDVCHGQRYNRETLEIQYKGKNIHDVLALTVEHAFPFFEPVPTVARKLQTLLDVGLGYITLGQSATTLSGGERNGSARTRSFPSATLARTLYILDEPTTGLHFHDIEMLLMVLHRLRDHGNTVVVLEHNLDVIKTADWVIDLGLEGGAGGGAVLVEGTPEDIANAAESYTGRYLKRVLDAHAGRKARGNSAERAADACRPPAPAAAERCLATSSDDRRARVVRIRRPLATQYAADADATATMYIASRRAMLPGLRETHTEAETRKWMRDVVFARHSVRLADLGGEIIGFAARDGAWLMHLYVKPGWTGRKVGSQLLEAVLMDASTATPVLRLHTFASNSGARRFYERHGFLAVAFGDGSGNEEHEPISVTSARSASDLRLATPGARNESASQVSREPGNPEVRAPRRREPVTGNSFVAVSVAPRRQSGASSPRH